MFINDELVVRGMRINIFCTVEYPDGKIGGYTPVNHNIQPRFVSWMIKTISRCIDKAGFEIKRDAHRDPYRIPDLHVRIGFPGEYNKLLFVQTSAGHIKIFISFF